MLIHRILHTVRLSCVYQKMGVRACIMKALLSQAVALLPLKLTSLIICQFICPHLLDLETIIATGE